ncbi:MAG: GYD domain-containing protein [Gemmatimonadota bacterium]|nr:GYD domain-containing protein [Gemmatimonadota bacterium]
MPKYLMEATYTAEGAKGLAKEGGSARRKTVDEMVKSLGGNVEAFYYAFGTAGVFLIVDVPDAVTAAAVSLAVNQSGAVQLKSHVLMTAEEMDQAAKKTVSYRAPGK